MTTLAIIGDVHAHMRNLSVVLAQIKRHPVDGILLVGDIGSHDLGMSRQRTPKRDKRYHGSLKEVFSAVAMLGKPLAYVPGNHDLPTLQQRGNADHTVLDVGGLRVAGIGGAGPDLFGFCYEWTEDQIRARPSPPCDVILAHCPPARTPLDLVIRRDIHVGSEAIRERCEAHTGFLVCGHIHESAGCIQLGDCLVLNAGGLGKPFGRPLYGLIKRDEDGDHASLYDLEAGTDQHWTRT